VANAPPASAIRTARASPGTDPPACRLFLPASPVVGAQRASPRAPSGRRSSRRRAGTPWACTTEVDFRRVRHRRPLHTGIRRAIGDDRRGPIVFD
jgi:hypothetical protein